MSAPAPLGLTMGSPAGRLALAATVAGSAVAMIAAVLTVVAAVIAWCGLPSTLRPSRRRAGVPEIHEHPHAQLDCPPPVRQMSTTGTATPPAAPDA
ncbi:hypothetical protein BH23ACT9_BH23ACT9_26390 [soil metagenome]